MPTWKTYRVAAPATWWGGCLSPPATSWAECYNVPASAETSEESGCEPTLHSLLLGKRNIALIRRLYKSAQEMCWVPVYLMSLCRTPNSYPHFSLGLLFFNHSCVRYLFCIALAAMKPQTLIGWVQCRVAHKAQMTGGTKGFAQSSFCEGKGRCSS